MLLYKIINKHLSKSNVCPPFIFYFISIEKGICGNFPLPYPPDDEREEITVFLDEKCAALETLIAKKTALLTELETYKKSLIYEYVTGKKEVPACP